MAKRLTLRAHIAKMVDVCGPSYGRNGRAIQGVCRVA